MDGIKRELPPWALISAGFALIILLAWWFNRTINPGPSPQQIEAMIQGGSAAGPRTVNPATGTPVGSPTTSRMPHGSGPSTVGAPRPGGNK